MIPYEQLSREQQTEALRRVAFAGAAAFGLDVAALELVIHGYNTTFRVDVADGRRFALRVNTSSQSTPANLRAQLAWQHALRLEAGVLVPDPLASPDGRWHVTVPSPELGRDATVVVNSWLEGEDVGAGSMEPAIAEVLGATMARMHAHAEGWTMPPGAALPVFDEPLFGDEDLLSGRELPGDGAAVIAAAFARSRAAFSDAYAGQRTIPLHADLHGANLKWHAGRLAVFDFDDAGMGIPLLDLAIALFYLRDENPAPETALVRGYASVRPLPEGEAEHLEGMVAARQLLLANALLASSNAEWQADAADYVDVTVDRLRHWLATGRFTRALPA